MSYAQTLSAYKQQVPSKTKKIFTIVVLVILTVVLLFIFYRFVYTPIRCRSLISKIAGVQADIAAL